MLKIKKIFNTMNTFQEINSEGLIRFINNMILFKKHLKILEKFCYEANLKLEFNVFICEANSTIL